jgi:hypothetical protein
VTPSFRQPAAERQKKEEWEKEDVPVAGGEHDSGKHESPGCEAGLSALRCTAHGYLPWQGHG